MVTFFEKIFLLCHIFIPASNEPKPRESYDSLRALANAARVEYPAVCCGVFDKKVSLRSDGSLPEKVQNRVRLYLDEQK